MIKASAARMAMASLACVIACVAGSATAVAAGREASGPAQVVETETGPVLADPAGRTLYTFRFDEATPGKSRCINTRYTIQNGRQFGKIPIPAAETRKTCADKRPPFLAGADARPSGDWTLIPRDVGARQWAYKGSPLYTSTKDRRLGEVNGETLVSTYTVVNPARPAQTLPPGFSLIRREEGVVVGTADGRPAYVRSGGGSRRNAADAPELLEPLRAPSFGTLNGKWSIMEVGGLRQYAFGGAPLYVLPEGYSHADVEAEGGWKTAIYQRAAPIPSQFRTRTTMVGKVYTTDKGMTLYSFSCTESEVPDLLPCDDPGDAAAYMSALCGDGKECARRWRLYRPTANARPSGEFTIEDVAEIPFTDAASVTSPPGSATVKAWAYRGKPLYTFIDDEAPGDTLGDWITYFSRSSFDAVLVPGPGIY